MQCVIRILDNEKSAFRLFFDSGAKYYYSLLIFISRMVSALNFLLYPSFMWTNQKKYSPPRFKVYYISLPWTDDKHIESQTSAITNIIIPNVNIFACIVYWHINFQYRRKSSFVYIYTESPIIKNTKSDTVWLPLHEIPVLMWLCVENRCLAD